METVTDAATDAATAAAGKKNRHLLVNSNDMNLSIEKTPYLELFIVAINTIDREGKVHCLNWMWGKLVQNNAAKYTDKIAWETKVGNR